MSTNAIKLAIANYLDAVEKKHGAGVRTQTSVEHREGTTLVIRQANKHPQLIDLGMLLNLTHSLKSYA